MKATRELILMMSFLGMILSVCPLWAAEPPAAPSASGDEAGAQSLTEVNKKMTNPTSNLWYLNFQQNNYRLDMGEDQGDRWNSNLNFQPVMPVALTEGDAELVAWCKALELSVATEPLEKRIRVEGVKTGLITALDLPGQIEQALAAGLINAAEAAQLREFDRKVMDIINVDDFNGEELMAAVQVEPRDSGEGASRLQVA